MTFGIVLVALLALLWLVEKFGVDSRTPWTRSPMDDWPFHRPRG